MRDLSTVFNDLLTLSICSFHSINLESRCQEKDEANEKIYFEALGRYDRPDIDAFPKLLGMMIQDAHEEPFSDLLGEYFTEHITRGHNGQYFTPQSICDLMAAFTVATEGREVSTQRVYDAACGSGRLLMASAKVNDQNIHCGNDVSRACAQMTALNMYMNGMRGEAAWMNTLSMQWHGGWHVNLDRPGILPIEKENSLIWTEAPKGNNGVHSSGIQLDLF